MKIRKDNDFVLNWAINWNGVAEDFTGVTDIVITASVFGSVKTIPDTSYSIIGNIVRIEFTPEICNINGVYRLELKYSKQSPEFVDGERRSAVDVRAFQIVETSDQADATQDVSVTSDAVAGFALKYEDLTAEQKEELRGKGIASIELTAEDGDVKTYTITYADGETFDFDVRDGHSPVFTFSGTVLLIDGVPQVNLKGETGNGIASIELTSTVGLVKTYTITFTDSTTTTFVVTDGSTPVLTFQGTTIYVNGVAGPNLKGETGKGISAVTLLSTAGLAKTYRITFTDSTTFDYVVTDGAAGVGAAVVQTTGASINDVMSQKAVTDDLALKAAHGYASAPKTLKQVDDNLAQLAGDVKDTTEKAGAASLAELNARLLALEKIVSSTLRSKIEVTREFNVWGKTNLILYGAGANTKAPDFIGQKYIDTTGGNVYVAVGTTSAGNWKLV